MPLVVHRKKDSWSDIANELSNCHPNQSIQILKRLGIESTNFEITDVQISCVKFIAEKFSIGNTRRSMGDHFCSKISHFETDI